MPPKSFSIKALPVSESAHHKNSVGAAGTGVGAHGGAITTAVNLCRVSSGSEYPVSPMALGNDGGAASELAAAAAAAAATGSPIKSNNNNNGNGSNGNTPQRVRGGTSPTTTTSSTASGSPSAPHGSSTSFGSPTNNNNGNNNNGSGRAPCGTLDFIQQHPSFATLRGAGGSVPVSPAFSTFSLGGGGTASAITPLSQHPTTPIAASAMGGRSGSAAAAVCGGGGGGSGGCGGEWKAETCVRLAHNVVRMALKEPNTYHVIKTISCPHRAQREIDHYHTRPTHPSILRYLKVAKKDAHSPTLVTMEYANRGTLQSVIADLNDLSAAYETATTTTTTTVTAQQQQQQADVVVVVPSVANAATADDVRLAEQRQQLQATRENLAKSVARQIIEALLYYERVHRRWHRDVKPDNIFCRSDGVLKLSDFDVSRQASGTVAAGAHTTTGTPDYMAPDYLRAAAATSGYHVDPGKADVWSIGCVLFQVVFGRVPCSGRRNMMEPITVEMVERDRQVLGRVQDPQLRALLRRCLVWDSAMRACLAEAAAMTYFFFCCCGNDSSSRSPSAAAATMAGGASSSTASATVSFSAADASLSTTATTPPSLQQQGQQQAQPARSRSPTVTPTAACDLCVSLCDCTMSMCANRTAASPVCGAAFDSYGADANVHPLMELRKQREENDDEEQEQEQHLSSRIPSSPCDEIKLAETIECMKQALSSEMETLRKCLRATRIRDLATVVLPTTTADRRKSNTEEESATAWGQQSTLGGSSANNLALSQAPSSTSLADAAPEQHASTVVSFSSEHQTPQQQQQQQSPLLFASVSPGTALDKLTPDERAQFERRFGEFVTKHRLSVENAQRALLKTTLTEEQVVIQAIQYCVTAEIRKHWTERSRPVYAAMKAVLQGIDNNSMRSVQHAGGGGGCGGNGDGCGGRVAAAAESSMVVGE